MTSVRYVVAGLNVRFFLDRADAGADANRRTRASNVQHDMFKPAGYSYHLVSNVRGEIFDVDGKLPDSAAEVLRDHISFGDVARHQMGMQCQYAKDFLADENVNEGVRWQGRLSDYHGLTIHKDDVAQFVERVQTWRRAQGIIA